MSRYDILKKRVLRLLVQAAALIVAYVCFCMIWGLLVVVIGLPALEAAVDKLHAARGSELSMETVALDEELYVLGLVPLVAIGVVIAYVIARRLYFVVYKSQPGACQSTSQAAESL
ncbi:MAG: hypothetical protein GY842_06010 [bacterium]|nr:hypothetical protein [bacterium]